MPEGCRPSVIALTNSGLTPAFRASGACTSYSYCCVHCRAVRRMTNSVSFCPMLLWNRRYSPVFCSRLINSGLRSSGTNGPASVPLGPATNSSAAFLWASVICSLGIGGIRSCATALSKNKNTRQAATTQFASITRHLLSEGTSRMLTDTTRDSPFERHKVVTCPYRVSLLLRNYGRSVRKSSRKEPCEEQNPQRIDHQLQQSVANQVPRPRLKDPQERQHPKRV